MSSDPILLISFCMFSVVVNLRVFWVVIVVSRRRLRPVSILVAHLSSVAICYSLTCILHTLDKWELLRLGFGRAGLCEGFFYFANLLYTTFPLNVVGIIYESIRRSHATTSGNLRVIKVILLIWIQAGLFSIPMTLMVEYDPDMGKCKPIQFLGNGSITLVYELLRFFFYTVIVVGYMTYAVFKIRSKLRYLYILQPIPNRRMRRKVQKIRFVCVHSIVFILLYTPAGILMLLYGILLRYKNDVTGVGLSLLKVGSKLMILTSVIFFLLSPLIYVWFIERISPLQFCLGKCATSNEGEGRNNVTIQTGGMEGEVGGIRINYSELSRISTAGRTGTSDVVSYTTSIGLSRRQPVICVTPPSPLQQQQQPPAVVLNEPVVVHSLESFCRETSV